MTDSLTRENEGTGLLVFRFSFQMYPTDWDTSRLRSKEWPPSRATGLVDPPLCVGKPWRKRYSPTPTFVHFPPTQIYAVHLTGFTVHFESLACLSPNVSDQMLCPIPLRPCTLHIFVSPWMLFSLLHIFGILVGKLIPHFGTSHSQERRISPTLLQPVVNLLLL